MAVLLSSSPSSPVVSLPISALPLFFYASLSSMGHRQNPLLGKAPPLKALFDDITHLPS